jgi:tetratricopeptide (TPR) repeat protein
MLNFKRLFDSRIFCCFLLTAGVLLAYSPTFTGEFILDDKPLIEKNPYVRDLHPIGSYLIQEDGVSEQSPSGYHTGYYRPLLNLTYWLDLQIWGLNAPGFRTTNVMLHLLTCFILMGLIRRITGHRNAAFLAALLFALHPIATESVSWVTSRNNILATLFGLGSLYFYMRGWEARRYKFLLLSILCFAGAVLSKEFGLMLMPIFFLFHRTQSKREDIGEELLFYAPFVLITVLYFIFRKNATGSVLTPVEMGNIWPHLLFAPYLILYNLQLILFPYRLHSFIIGYPESYVGWQALAGYGCVAALVLVVWYMRHQKTFVFGLLGFLIGLFPVLNVIPMKSATLVSMRWLYFPATFLTAAAAVGIYRLLSVNRPLGVCFILAVASYLGAYSHGLNGGLWHDEYTFLKQEVTGFTNMYYARGYAMKLLDGGKYDQAERYFLDALKYDPGKAKTYVDYAGLLIDRRQPAKALTYLETARKKPMGSKLKGRWHNNAGMAYFRMGQSADALKHFEKAVKYGRNTSEFWANLGATYGAMGDYDSAVRVLEKGLSLIPGSKDLRRNLAVTGYLMGNPEKAMEALEGLPARELERDKSLQKLMRRHGPNPQPEQ